MEIVVDGNDGTGKSTLVYWLRARGYQVHDRGLPTRMTDNEALSDSPYPGEQYIILDAPVEVCQERLQKAGKDLSERYHRAPDLALYRVRFQKVAEKLGAPVVDASGDQQTTLSRVLQLLELPDRRPRIGIPKSQDFHWVKPALGVCLIDQLVLRPRSIPHMVALGLLDFGVCGEDLLQESGDQDRFEKLAAVPHEVRLVAAAKTPHVLRDPPPRPLVVATEYPNVCDTWLTGKGLSHVCIQSGGSTESWADLWADLIVDIVDTGASLRQHDLVEIETLLTSRPVLVKAKGRGKGLMAHSIVSQLQKRMGVW